MNSPSKGFYASLIIGSAIVLGIGYFLPEEESYNYSPALNAIDKVKSEIPLNMKVKVWYSYDWEQSSIDDKTWMVTVADGIWKVSRNKTLCSESGLYVSVCSENGTAKRYSNLGFCKPSTLCENKQINVKSVNILEEVKKIDTSKLSYSQEEISGWKHTQVNGIPEIVRRAIYYQTSEYERKNKNAQIDDTCRELAKRYRLPYKAIESIYLEGVLKNWES